MDGRPPLSREASCLSLAESSRSRRRSFESDDENVFSDNYALDFSLSSDHTPLRGFPPPCQQFFDNPFTDPSNIEHVSDTIHDTQSLNAQSDSASTTKTRLMIDDAPSPPARGLRHTLSTSSRLTIPRSQSPYVGPSAPSHPYAMYPQMTRNPSVASQSTFRSMPESSFAAHARPEHPYHMYPQNTVEAEDEDITSNGIPMGFPRGTHFQSSVTGPGGEVGDIIGADGHIEQLPPYSRYADNTVAKGNMDDLSRRVSRASRISRTQTHISEPSTTVVPMSESSSATLLPPTELFEQGSEDTLAKKEGWRHRAQKRTIAGLPVWVIIVIVLSVFFSAIIGGVVGGVIGNKQGAERAYAEGARVTTTMWLDAVPTTLGPGTPQMPTGHFQIPLNQSEEIKQCIPNPAYYPTWGCMDIAYIGILVFQDNDTETGNATMKAVFEDFSVNTQDFKYGPQPPDFNGSEFTLSPMMDKDAGELGVAMFFSVLFDKLSIIPEDVLQVPAGKRSIDSELLTRDTAIYDGKSLRPSDRPWFCFWNSTINEFFVYLNQEAPQETTSTTYVHNYQQSSSSVSPTPTMYQSTTSGVLAQGITLTTAFSPTPTSVSATTFLAYNPVKNIPTTTADNYPHRRSYESSAPDMKDYPKLIKMVEKRKPIDNSSDYVQPYCQQMQVLDDWTIEPIYTIPAIGIEEILYPSSTIQQKRVVKRQDRDVVAELESFCICEWSSH